MGIGREVASAVLRVWILGILSEPALLRRQKIMFYDLETCM